MRTPRVAIIGAGMSGIGMGAKLRMAGIDTFHIYEKWNDLGGTWHANTYPGLSCDVPSRNYQFTFAPNPDWSHLFSPGPEIWAYLDRVARQFGLREQMSFRDEVEIARWEDGEWLLRTKAGEEARYDFIVTAAGGLVHTKTPDITGLETFEGARFHSAEWEHSVPLEGRRIGVIGTGSTGMQITRALAPVAGKYELYQRTPQWIAPLGNRRYTRLGKWLLRRFPQLNKPLARFWQVLTENTFGIAVVRPGWQRKLITWFCHRHLRKISDPDLRRRFTPADKPMCKRLVMGKHFYELFERPNVELVDTPIDHVEPKGIRTSDGELHELDVIVMATGFDAHKFVRPMELIGAGGVKLSEVWEPEPFGYRSVALPGFPNVFTLIGPHSPFGNQSLFLISETQADFTMNCIGKWRRGEIDAMHPTRAATDRFNAEMREVLPDTIWSSGCKSWYLGADGTPSVWPYEASHHREILQEPEPEDWEVVRELVDS